MASLRALILALSLVFSIQTLCSAEGAEEEDRPDFAEALEQLDTDKDGLISYDEFVKSAGDEGIPEKQKAIFDKVFKAVDANDDGKIGADEFPKLIEEFVKEEGGAAG